LVTDGLLSIGSTPTNEGKQEINKIAKKQYVSVDGNIVIFIG